MKKTTNGFAKLTWADFRKQLDVIVKSMTGNPNFSTLQAQVTALAAAADAYYVLDTKAETRDKNVLVVRNLARIEITNMLHRLGFGVTAVSIGNEEMLSSSGFPFTQPPQKTVPLTQPNPPVLSAGANKGVIKVKAKRQKGTVSYNYYITPAPTGGNTLSASATWDVSSHNAGKFDFADLVSSQPYLIKVGLVGVRGQEVISDAISYTPQ
ncbi:MAG: hypothetical protein M3040_01125 [Bacteroidota bacterium]|nr:hypothetical protein [Bacteroidota bacterium]